MLKGARVRWLALSVAIAAFACLGLLIAVTASGSRVGGLLMAVGCGALAIFLAARGLAPERLVLTPEGLTTISFGRPTTRRWTDVESFSVAPVRNNAIVTFEPDPRAAGGQGGFLPETYGLKADDLAALLNEWKQRYGASPR